jgi:drug/metabolite transporter (DMT)-like permease
VAGEVGGEVAVALGAAFLFGLAAALQHQQARAVELSTRPSLLLMLVRRPLWVLGIAVDFSGVGLQALALRLGSVSLVQTVLVAALPVATVLSALLARRWLRRPEVLGLVLCSVGLAVLCPALTSTPHDDEPSRSSALLAAGVIALLVLPGLLLRRYPRLAGAAAGVVAGLVVGSGSVLLSVTASRIGDWPALFGSWAVYATVLVGVTGILLVQVAFQTGDLGAPLAALALTEPLTSVALAVTVLGEAAPELTVAAVGGGLLAVVGVIVLSRDPLR